MLIEEFQKAKQDGNHIIHRVKHKNIKRRGTEMVRLTQTQNEWKSM